MAVALDQFVKNLEDSGIVSPSKLKSFLPPAAAPKDAKELILALVRQKHLTKFQAQEIYQGRAASLILGSYTIVDQIGAGGMGQVFKAEHRRMHRTVAIKVLPTSTMKDGAAIARFGREVEAAAKLSHPNIVTAHDADESEGRHFLVMEYVEGSDLSALVKANGPIPASIALNYVLQAARGLEFAHGEGVVHRDIKPANLLLDKRGTVKILDMGLAPFDTPGGGPPNQAELTTTGTVMGTVDYMSPEQAFNTRSADARADIYSLGCTLHYLVMAKAVYDGQTFIEKVLAHRERAIPSLAPLLSDEADEVFARMIAKTAEDRYQTMSEVVAALESCAQGSSNAEPTQTLAPSAAGNGNLTFLTQTRQRALTNAPAVGVRKPKPTGDVRRSQRTFVLIGAGLFAFLIALAAVIIKLPTKEGMLVVEVDQPDAMIEILDVSNDVEITRPGGAGKVTIGVDPGKHRLRVSKDGFEFFAQEFSMESGGRVPLKAKLVSAAEKPAGVAKGEHAENGPKKLLAFQTPGFDDWVKSVAALPAEKQVGAIVARLRELNPDYDGVETHAIKDGVVTTLELCADKIIDISPVRALTKLENFSCEGKASAVAAFEELSPLRGLKLRNVWLNGTSVADISPIANDALESLWITFTKVADLGPLKGRQLKKLDIHRSKVTDLGPLEGLPLESLWAWDIKISNLAPLKGSPITLLNIASTQVNSLEALRDMPLKTLLCNNTPITDISPLAGAQLVRLGLRGTKVTDLSLIQQMPLKELNLPPDVERHMDLVRSITTLGLINDRPAGEFWKQIDAAPTKSASVGRGMGVPEFAKWRSEVAALSPDEQVKAVVARLRELNPEFDGVEKHRIKDGFVANLEINADKISDISPVAALAKLQNLVCDGQGKSRGALSDLRPLAELKLKTARLNNTRVADISPLNTAELTDLNIAFTDVVDLAPLHGSRLRALDIHCTRIRDLTPLAGLPLDNFWAWGAKITDLAPLEDAPLTVLHIGSVPVDSFEPLRGKKLRMLIATGTKASDISPLEKMPLVQLALSGSPVTDLSPLKGLPLKELSVSFKANRDAAILHEIKSLEKINDKPAADFWKRLEQSADSSTRDYSLDRELAAWALESGMVVVRIPGQEQSGTISKLEQLPKTDFALIGLQIGDSWRPMSEADVEALAELPELESLQIVAQKATSITLTSAAINKLAKLPKLRALVLFTVHLTPDAMDAIPAMKQLAFLSINGSHPTTRQLRQLAQLDKLEHLIISFTSANDETLGAVSTLGNLQELRVNNTNVTDDGVAELAPLRRLATLHLGHTRITDRSLATLAKMPVLSVLSLQSCGITDDGLAQLKTSAAPRQLLLEKTKITDAGLESLASMKQLEAIALEGCPITEAGLRKLRAALPKCKITH